MAFLKNPIVNVVGNSDPAKLDLECEVKVQFSDLDRAILQSHAGVPAFRVYFEVKGQDPAPEPYITALQYFIGPFDFSLSAGNPDVHLKARHTFSRGGRLDEDPFPFPNDEDEIYVTVTLYNLFSNATMGTVNSSVIRGRF